MLYPFCLLRGNCKCISWKWVTTGPQLNCLLRRNCKCISWKWVKTRPQLNCLLRRNCKCISWKWAKTRPQLNCLLRGNCKCISWKWVKTRPQLNQRIKKGPAVLVVAILNFGFRGGNTYLIEELFCSFYKTYFLRPILYCTLRCSHFPSKFLCVSY
jgi:hypothetical protein